MNQLKKYPCFLKQLKNNQRSLKLSKIISHQQSLKKLLSSKPRLFQLTSCKAHHSSLNHSLALLISNTTSIQDSSKFLHQFSHNLKLLQLHTTTLSSRLLSLRQRFKRLKLLFQSQSQSQNQLQNQRLASTTFPRLISSSFFSLSSPRKMTSKSSEQENYSRGQIHRCNSCQNYPRFI
jgi:hypothetical protein